MDISITILDILGRGIPESFLLMLGIYAITKTPINKKKYVYSSIIACLMLYFIRKLPINFGVHTIIMMFIINIVAVNFNKIDFMGSIKATASILAAQFIFEGINLILLVSIVEDVDAILMDPVKKLISGIPSLVMLFLAIMFIYKRGKKEEKNNEEIVVQS